HPGRRRATSPRQDLLSKSIDRGGLREQSHPAADARDCTDRRGPAARQRARHLDGGVRCAVWPALPGARRWSPAGGCLSVRVHADRLHSYRPPHLAQTRGGGCAPDHRRPADLVVVPIVIPGCGTELPAPVRARIHGATSRTRTTCRAKARGTAPIAPPTPPSVAPAAIATTTASAGRPTECRMTSGTSVCASTC